MHERYVRNPYGSMALGGYSRRYGDASYREYDRDSYSPEAYRQDMNQNYQNYMQKQYVPYEISRESLNDTMDSIVNIIAMLKREARSPEELDLIKRYIVTINQL